MRKPNITDGSADMKKDTIRLHFSRCAAILGKEHYGKNLTVWLTMFFSIISILLSLPYSKWISVINTDALYKKLKLKASVIETLDTKYSLYNILTFVKDTKAGSIGLYTMLLLFVMIATMYFLCLYIFRVFVKKKNTNGNLNLYLVGKSATFFGMLLTLGLTGYISFSASKLGVKCFALSPMAYIVGILSFISYVLIKIVEVEERKKYKEHGFFHEFKKNWVLFLMLIPTFIYFMINAYLPMLGVYFAFTSFNFRDGLWASPYIGFKNFEHLLRADLYRLTKNTILYNLVFILVGNVAQVAFAIFISQLVSRWFKRTTQTLIFMPYFVSFVILKVLVYNLFEYKSGVINTMLVASGLERIDFYNTPYYWPFLITIFYLWKNLGYGMVVYLAAITGISDEYFEAAKIDGANIFQQIRYITLPLIKPTFIILLLYALGSIMKGQFELFYQLIGNNGVLYNATDIFDTYVYRITTTQPLNIGIGTAAGLYQAVFGFVLIMVTNAIVKKSNPNYALF